MLRHRQRLVMMEEYALEYINHEVLCKRSTYRADKTPDIYSILSYSAVVIEKAYKYLLAYQELAKKLTIPPLYARALERQFRKYFFTKMKAMVREGLTDISQIPEEPRWMRLVEEKLNTLPILLQDLNRRRQEKVTSPDEVVSALCTQATLRGTLCAREVYGSVARELRLSARVSDLHAAWVSAQRVSLRYLSISSRAGDAPGSALSLSHAQVADLVLLHTDVNTLHLVTDESDNIEAESKALAVLWRIVQRHRVEERAPPRSRVRAQRWTRAYHDYLASNRLATLVVLQRRWHELKLRARARALAAHRHAHGHAHAHVHAPHAHAPRLTDLDVAILKKYPHIVTSPLASWLTLVRRGSIITQLLSDVESDQDSDECDKQVFTEDAAKPTAKLDPKQGNNPSMSKPAVNADHGAVVSGHKDIHYKENRDIIEILKSIDPSKVTTEVFIESDTENEISDAVYKSENGPYDEDSTVDICVNEEPRSMADRIVFANDNDITIQEIDDEIIEGNFDPQLLMNTRVKLTRVEDTPAWRQYSKEDKYINASYFAIDDVSIKSETEDVDSDVTESKMAIIFKDDSDVVDSDYEGEIPAKIPRLNSAGVPGEHQVSCLDLQPQNAGQNSDVGQQKSSKTQAQKIRDDYEVMDSDDVATIANKETISMPDLATLLAELPTAGKVEQLSTSGIEYCCPARKHIEISDHRQFLGLPSLPPHTHDNGPCTCCCGNIRNQSAREQADVDLKALENDITAILQLSFMRKEKEAQLKQRNPRPPRPPRKKSNKTVKRNNKKSSTEETAVTSVAATVPKTTESVANATLTDKTKSQSTRNSTLEGAKKASMLSLEGYDEWIRQKNVNTQFFLLQGVNKKDKAKTATIPTEVTPARENTSYKPPKSYLRLSSQENNANVLQNEAQHFEVNAMQNNAITQQFEDNKIQNNAIIQQFEVNKIQNNGFTQQLEVNNIQNNAITQQFEVNKIQNASVIMTKNPTLEGAKKASTLSLEGYDEWIRQKNVNTQFFFLQGVNKKDKAKTATMPTEVTPARETTSYKPPKSYLRLSSQDNNTHVLQNEEQHFKVNKMQNNAITQQFKGNKIQNNAITQQFEVNKIQNACVIMTKNPILEGAKKASTSSLEGYDEWIRQKNVNTQFFLLQGVNKKDKAKTATIPTEVTPARENTSYKPPKSYLRLSSQENNANVLQNEAQHFEVNKMQNKAITQNNEEKRLCNQINKANDIPVKIRDTSICLAKQQNEIIESDLITVNIGETSISASGKNKDLLQKLYTHVINRRDEQDDEVIISNRRDEQNDIIIISDEDSRDETEELTEEIQAPAKETQALAEEIQALEEKTQAHADETQALEEETQAPAEVTQALAEETAAPYTSESIIYAATHKLIELNNAYKNAFEVPPTTNKQSLMSPNIINSRGESLSINRKEVFSTSKQTQKNIVLVAPTISRKPTVCQAPTIYNTSERPRQEPLYQDAMSGQSATNYGRNPNYLMVVPYIAPKPADKQISPNESDYPRFVPFIQRESNNAQRSCKMCSTLSGDQIREPLALPERTGGQSASTTSDNPTPPQLNQPDTTTSNQSTLICNTKSGDSIVTPNVQPVPITGQASPTVPVLLIRQETSIEKNYSENCNTTSGNLITPPMLPEPTIGQTPPTKLPPVPFIRQDIIGQRTSISNTSENQYMAQLIQPDPTSGQIAPIERNNSIPVLCKRRYSIGPKPTGGQTASIQSNESIPELFYQQEVFEPRTSSIRSSTSVNQLTAPSMQPEPTSGQTALIDSNSIVVPFNRRDNSTGQRSSFIPSPTSSNRFMAPLMQPEPTSEQTAPTESNNSILVPFNRRENIIEPRRSTIRSTTSGNVYTRPPMISQSIGGQTASTEYNNRLPASVPLIWRETILGQECSSINSSSSENKEVPPMESNTIGKQTSPTESNNSTRVPFIGRENIIELKSSSIRSSALMNPTNHSVDSNTGTVASVNPPKVISERNVATDCRTNLDDSTLALVVEALPKPKESGRQIAVTKPSKVKPAPLLIPESISMQNDLTNNGPESNIVPPGIDFPQNSNVELQSPIECATKSKPSIPSSKSIKILSSITLNQNNGPKTPLNKPSSSCKKTQSSMNKDKRKSDKESPTRVKGVVDVNKSALNKIIIPKEARSSKPKTKSSAVPLLYNDADTMEAYNTVQDTITLNSNNSNYDKEHDEWLKHKNVNKQFFKPPGTPMEDIIVNMKTKKRKHHDKIKKKSKRKEKIKKHKHKKYKHDKEITEVMTDSDTSVEIDTAILDAPVENQISTLRQIPLPSEEIESEILMHNALVKNKTSCQEKKTPHREMQLRLDRVQIERNISVHDTISSSDDGATPSKIPRPNSDCKIFSFCPNEPSVHNETILHDIQDNHKIKAESLINNLQVASAETDHNSMDCSEILLHTKTNSRKIQLDSQSDHSELVSYDLPFCSETSYYSQIPLHKVYQREKIYNTKCLNEQPLLMPPPPPLPPLPPLPASPSPQDAQELAETLEDSAPLEVPSMDEVGKTLKRLPSVEGTSEWYSEIRTLVESPTLPKLRIRVVRKSAINQTEETTTATIIEEVVAQPDDATLMSDVDIDEIPLPEMEPPAIDVSLNDIPLPIEQPPVEVILLSCVGPQDSDTLVSKIPEIDMECVADVLSKESQPAQSPESWYHRHAHHS